jgi:tryptophanyl-tRNA synthetase
MNIVTGLQPTGELHIGNYFGALEPMKNKINSLTSKDNFYLMVVDLHALTIEIDYANYYKQILENLRVYLASGINLKNGNVHLFRQSHISAHSELNWLLSCFTYFGEMSRMTQFKDKSKENNSNINCGLFSYPILMASDILLYDAPWVPVGEDQRQHLELARDIAIRINNKFNSDIFTVPENYSKQLEFFKQDNPLRIRSLSNPDKKMSKSSDDLKSKILLSDKPEDANRKIMSATTDNLSNINWDYQNQAGITNLMQILALTESKTVEEIKKDWIGTARYGDFKKVVANSISNFLSNYQDRLSKITTNDVLHSLSTGEIQANLQAKHTLLRFQKYLGLRK